jgi:colanic acid biosynthesis glycosyl transferase WcaI
VKIGIVSQWFPPEPAFIPGGLARELAARGHDVRVLTGFPNYPGGVVHEGYRQRWQHVERDGGVTVRRVPLYPSHDASAVRRVANYGSFAVTSAAAAVRYLSAVDVLYVYHPPATSFAGPALLRRLRGVPSVLHVQDVWPDSVTASPMAPHGRTARALDTALGWAMRRIYREASSIAVIAPSMRDLLVQRGADPAKVEVVLNWAEESVYRPVPVTEAARRELGHRNRCTLVYAGNLGALQGLETAVRAAAMVEDRAPVDLVVIGSGTEEGSLRKLSADLGAGNIRFLGRRPPHEMAALYAAADHQLVVLRDLPFFHGTIPSKLQTALACGSPVIVSAPGDAARFVEETGVGLVCPPGDVDALADRFVQAASAGAGHRAALGARARATYESQMSMQSAVDRLEDMLYRAAGATRGYAG